MNGILMARKSCWALKKLPAENEKEIPGGYTYMPKRQGKKEEKYS